MVLLWWTLFKSEFEFLYTWVFVVIYSTLLMISYFALLFYFLYSWSLVISHFLFIHGFWVLYFLSYLYLRWINGMRSIYYLLLVFPPFYSGFMTCSFFKLNYSSYFCYNRLFVSLVIFTRLFFYCYYTFVFLIDTGIFIFNFTGFLVIC